MQRRRDRAERKQRAQIRHIQRLRLEDALEERHVDERELDDEGHGDGAEEHFVLRDAAAEAAVLERGHEVEEDEACEGLRGHSEPPLSGCMYTEGEGETDHSLFSA